MISRKNLPGAALIAALLIALCFSMPSYAQMPGPPEGRPEKGKESGPRVGMNLEKHLSILRERLQLSDDQVIKVRNILEEHQKIADADREKNRGNRDEAMKAAEQRRRQTDEKIMGVLNDEQKKKYDKVKDEIHKETMKNRRGGKGKFESDGSGRRGGGR